MMLTTSPMKRQHVGIDARQRQPAHNGIEQHAAGPPEGAGPGHAAIHGLRLVVDGGQAQNFHFALAVGRDHDGGVSDFLVQQGAADWRTWWRSFPRSRRILRWSPACIRFLHSWCCRNTRTVEPSPTLSLGMLFMLIRERSAMRRPSCRSAGFDELLALLGHVILGVFAEIAQGHGFLEFLGKLVTQLMLERVNLLLQLFLDMLSHCWSKIINLWPYIVRTPRDALRFP